MTVPTWGLLGPSELSSSRRTRTLGVAVAVRSFNDLAVPGMGNVWFGKQMFLATLGVAVTERAANPRLRNIQVTNAVEAFACWTDLTDRGWEPDPRLRGSRKMAGKPAPTFRSASARGFYVSQPMRAASIQPLVSLGLVDASPARFNAFQLSEAGRHFVNLVTSAHRPDQLDVVSFLARWTNGSTRALTSPALSCLRPTNRMSVEARERLRALIVTREDTGSWIRRKAVMEWLDSSDIPRLRWSHRPREFEPEHWADLYLGSVFFRTRDAALQLLDHAEVRVAATPARRVHASALAADLQAPIERLRGLALEFLQPSPKWFPSEFGPQRLKERVSAAFCQDCSDATDVNVLTALVDRDDRVLRRHGDFVVPGPAFLDGVSNGDVDDADTDGPPLVSGDLVLPRGISLRIPSMFLLHQDLQGVDPVEAAS